MLIRVWIQTPLENWTIETFEGKRLMTLTWRARWICIFVLLFQGPSFGASVTFTQEQAAAGRQTYRQHCVQCHGAKLEGLQTAPGLAGARFDQTWRGKSAGLLSFHVRRMPPESVAPAGTLSNEDYTNVLAYLLISNGFDAGETALPSDIESLTDMLLPKLPGMDFDPYAPVEGGGDSPLLANLKPITDATLKNPSDEDWLSWSRTYDGQRFSPLSEINKETVKSLKVAWRAPLLPGNNMPTPLVYQGVLFMHVHPDTVVAMDATNGKVLWRYKGSARLSSQKMGIALHGDMVLMPTSDLHVVALNAKTGEELWDHEITTESTMRAMYNLRSAPLVVGDKVIQGITASAAPRGGFILALDIKTGKEAWRFNTIARPGEENGETWNGLPLDKRSGGSVWHQGTYDAELNLIYYGVAPTYDTGPLLKSINQPGITNDAYYTNCTIALDADTGKLVWYYQHMANDQWDLDWAFERQIVSMPVNGTMRKVVMNVGKMAILEALDAATGEYLFSVDSGIQNVITAIDPKKGAKTINAELMPDLERPCVVCPTAFGARSWPPTSYSPNTKLVYLPLTEWCMLLGPDGAKLLSSGVGISNAEHPDNDDKMLGRIMAMDVENQKIAWTHDQTSPPSTGLLATAGGLVFSGDIDPSLKAFDDTTGELLWQAPLDDLPSSTLMTYSVDGTQYVAVVLGMTNFHIRGLAGALQEFQSGSLSDATANDVLTGDGSAQAGGLRGGASIWVFALDTVE